MVKHLRHLKHVWLVIKRLVLLGTALLLVLGFWLHSDERSLNFARGWIVAAMNDDQAPFTIDVASVTVDWRDAAQLGKLHITNVRLAKRDGNVFAVLPEIFATVDPIGFLPTRHFLHKVILRQPHLSAARSADGNVEFGIEGSSERLPLTDLSAFFTPGNAQERQKAVSLPFHDFIIEDASLAFTDEGTSTNIVSSPFNLLIARKQGTFEALMSMPFTVDDEKVNIIGGLRKLDDNAEQHILVVKFTQLPARLICLFNTCPEKVEATGRISGKLAVGMTDDFAAHDFQLNLSTEKAVFTAPQWFAEPLKMAHSELLVQGNWGKQELNLKRAFFTLEDTNIEASGKLTKKEDGWYASGEGSCSKLDIRKLYKYWPLTMAHDSRAWITSKLKSGYAASGKLKLNLTPQDLKADVLPDTSVDAIAEARDITFEYLPGFPLVEHMDGTAHFTGTTVRVEGNTGSLLSGTKISKAVLWCPKLNEPKNPMEVELALFAPAADAATMLALPYFPFDDNLALDPKTIKGSIDATMKLKFDAFSGNPADADPNAIHLEKVDYDIATKLHDVAQDGFAGSYKVKSINGALNATMQGMNFDGTVVVGDAGASQVKLNQPSGQPLTLEVQSTAGEGKEPASKNDFSLRYASGEVPVITVTGKKLDASPSYGGKEHSLLANFPAMDLSVDVDELYLVKDTPLRDVKATLTCSAERCEKADFIAKTIGASTVKGGIGTVGGVRQFSMTSGDAGSLLKAFDITDRMTRGKFNLSGPYNDKLSPPQLDARLRIDDFTLKNSEILGRILSIGSLTGLKNALTGSGIDFDKMTASMSSRAGVITISKGIAQGTSIGITVSGQVDTRSTGLNLKGVVIPAYALNSILGKIPIIGALAGGEEGLIAVNYSVKGTYENPDVGVNPLSALTPGFLRGIFDAGEDAPSSITGPDASRKPAKGKATKPIVPSGVQKR